METLRFIMVTTHFPPYHLGGDAIFVKYLSEELVKSGHEVHVFHTPSAYQSIRGLAQPSSTEDVDARIARERQVSTIPRTDTLLSLTMGIWGKAQRELEELVRAVKPEVVHWHNTKGFIGKPFLVPGAVSLYTAHDYYAVCTRSNLMRPGCSVCTRPFLCQLCNLRWGKPAPLWRAGGRRVLRLPPEMRILAPSEYMAKRLGEDGIEVHRVIRNFVPNPGAHVRGSVTSEHLLLYIGMLEPHKGPQTLLEAFASTHKEHEFKLHIAGQGSLAGSLRRTTSRKGLNGRVTIPGSVSRNELQSLRQRASVQIIPSEWFENSPLTALEAFAAGTPLMGSSIGGLAEILKTENGAETFVPGSANDLASHLNNLWHNRTELRERSRLSRKAYEREFSPPTHMAAYMNILERE